MLPQENSKIKRRDSSEKQIVYIYKIGRNLQNYIQIALTINLQTVFICNLNKTHLVHLITVQHKTFESKRQRCQKHNK